MTRSRTLTTEIPHELAGLRLDQAMAMLFPDFSRARLQTWIKDGHALLDGVQAVPRQKLLGGERIELHAEAEEVVEYAAEAIPLVVVHADASIFVIDKPAGLVVHPAAGHPDGTLQNALLHLDPALAAIPRGGIVHRLDKDTSGLLVVARTLEAHKSLVGQLKDRSVSREYLALVQGTVTAGATVDEPIGRHPSDRKRFAVRPDGKESVTHYRVEEHFPHHTLLRVRLETGRTHQIRVHMAHLHHPLIGDPVYGGRARIPAGAGPALIEALRGFRRQALHAARLGLIHPKTGGEMAWESPLPPDFDALLRLLRGLT